MKKGLKKFTKILVLIAMIFSDLMTPISVLADQISESTPNKGDIGINGEVKNNGEMTTVSVGSVEEKGGVKVTKTVSKTDTEGRYKIDFKIEGKDDKTEVTKPVYAVVVFDRSGSMESTEKEECVRWEKDWFGVKHCVDSKIVSDNKWESAVNGAITFATTLSNKINESKIALVGFSGDSDYIRNDWTGEYTNTLKSDAKKEDDADVIKINGKEWFNGSELTSDKFGSPNGGTNLQAGLRKANELLSSIADADAKKYVVVISDGKPTFYYADNGYTKGKGNATDKDTYEKTISEATSVKNLGAEIFSIGYMLPTDKVYGEKTAADILTEVSSPDKEGSTFTHYVNADPEKVANAFNNIAEEMSNVNAGTNATLTDNIGGKFTVIPNETISIDGKKVTSKIANITEEGTTLSFYVDIDQDAPTDWYNTNEGFELKYTNAKGEEKTLTCDQNPQVYWVQNTYSYVINYYKDEVTNIDDSNYLGSSDARSAHKDAIITLTDADKNAYLDRAGDGYEFNSVDPEELVISTKTSENVINVLYTAKKFGYNDEKITKTADIDTVTSLDNKVGYTIKYNTMLNNVRKGDKVTVTITDKLPQSIDVDNSDLKNGTYDEKNNTITWVITYDVEEYASSYPVNVTIEYMVKYTDYIRVNGKKLTNVAGGITVVNDNTTKGSKDSEDVNVEIKGTVTVYFKDEEGNDIAGKQELGEKLAGTPYTTSAKEITGYTLKEEPTNKNGNYIEGNIDVIYYYTKNDGNITENELVKEGTEFVSNINDTFNYTLKYTGKVEEYVGKATLTITDTLPLKGTIVSKDNRCTFENNTITCTTEYTVNGTLEINEEFNFQVKYSDIKEDKIVNSATAKLVLENKEEETTDETETEVYKGTVVATYKTDKGVKLHDDVETTDFAGTNYTTETKSFYGYTLREIPSNKEGTYIANETIQVDYVYIKNEGTVTENKVNKVQNNTITDINSEYNYVLSYTGKVEDYVGEVTLELTDTLPYNAEIISKDNKCVVNGKTIVCTDVYTVDKEHQVINAAFNIVLRYTNVGSEVKNIVNSKLIYGNKNVTDKDEVIDVVPSGTVVATYKTDKGVTLSNNVTTTDLVGKEYTTEAKEFFGYTLKEIPSNKDGLYTKGTTYVNYVYTKNIGTSEEELNKDGIELVGSITDAFDYIITYNTKIKDYVGKATLTITDILPFEIDEEKSEISNSCKYNKENNTIVCKYEADNTNVNENNEIEEITFNIEENFKLYYINVDKKEVTNKVTAELTYENITKTTDDEHTTEVEEGTVIVNYVTKDGEKLTDSITLTGLVGTIYETVKKEFDKYSFIEVKGEVAGTYTKGQKEVTYVYDLTILPPQTGVEANMFMYVNYIFALIALAVAFRTYKTIKNN